ncbi:uncharacterized protein J3D65DRAFT_478656 [Phyllosticta citribraziliensis]|uniref:Uncharacterized protein n=1 Tax=Phyllosticta citribraziliensis TaxID=989973 RepID=A0ABR1LG92_9PEZI
MQGSQADARLTNVRYSALAMAQGRPPSFRSSTTTPHHTNPPYSTYATTPQDSTRLASPLRSLLPSSPCSALLRSALLCSARCHTARRPPKPPPPQTPAPSRSQPPRQTPAVQGAAQHSNHRHLSTHAPQLAGVEGLGWRAAQPSPRRRLKPSQQRGRSRSRSRFSSFRSGWRLPSRSQLHLQTPHPRTRAPIPLGTLARFGPSALSFQLSPFLDVGSLQP